MDDEAERTGSLRMENLMRKIYFKGIVGIIALTMALLAGGCAMGGATGKKTLEAQEALENGDYDQAQQLFAEAARDGEEQLLAYRGLGLAYMELAQYKEAVQAFEAALASADSHMEDNVLDVELYLATAQYRGGSYDEAAATCDRILEEYESADALFLRGASRLHDDMQDEAAADFDAAVELRPNSYDLYLDIYECYREQNVSGLGGAYLQSALAIQGDDMEHYYNRGRIYYYLEDYEEAQRQLSGPVEAEYEPALYLMGRVYLALGDYVHAQGMYHRIEEKSGKSAATCNGLALCALSSGEYDMALSYIAGGLELNSGDKRELYFDEIVAYEKKRDFATAKAKAKEYMQRYPADEAGAREWTFLSTR